VHQHAQARRADRLDQHGKAALPDLGDQLGVGVGGDDDAGHRLAQQVADAEHDVGPVNAAAQAIVADHEPRHETVVADQRLRLLEIVDGMHGDAPALQQLLDRLAEDVVVLDHQHVDADELAADHLADLGLADLAVPDVAQRHGDGEHRAVAGPRADIDRMTEQRRQTLGDVEPEPEALLAPPPDVVDLVELLENPLAMVRGDAGSGVPHLDAQAVADPPATEQHAPDLGIADGVGDEVADDPLEQRPVAGDRDVRMDDAERQALLRGLVAELDLEPLEQPRDLEGGDARHDLAGVELADVEQGAEQVLHDADGDVHRMQEVLAMAVVLGGHAVVDQDLQGRERLAEVVVGGPEEARLGAVGGVGQLLGLAQRALAALQRRDVVNDDDPEAAGGDAARDLVEAAVGQHLLGDPALLELGDAAGDPFLRGKLGCQLVGMGEAVQELVMGKAGREAGRDAVEELAKLDVAPGQPSVGGPQREAVVDGVEPGLELIRHRRRRPRLAAHPRRVDRARLTA